MVVSLIDEKALYRTLKCKRTFKLNCLKRSNKKTVHKMCYTFFVRSRNMCSICVMRNIESTAKSAVPKVVNSFQFMFDRRFFFFCWLPYRNNITRRFLCFSSSFHFTHFAFCRLDWFVRCCCCCYCLQFILNSKLLLWSGFYRLILVLQWMKQFFFLNFFRFGLAS